MNGEAWVNEYFDKKSEWVLITGASSGIGKEYLRYFARLGCKILSVCNDSHQNQLVAEEFSNKFNVEIVPAYCDLTDQHEVDKLLRENESKKVSLLINNAGFGLKGRFVDGDVEKFKAIIGLHVVAPTLLLRGLLPPMIKMDKGLVITVATVNVASPVPNNAVYTATKTYLFNLALAIAEENGDTQIKFQVLLPGTTDTPFHQKQGATPKSMTMTPDKVVRQSLADIENKICIPNSLDRVLFPLFARLPMKQRVKIAGLFLKKRLKM